jgi:N-carbamoyl-L-amino-acid hydrolase
MGQRRDAAVAVAEFALAVEHRARQQPATGTLVATVGQLEVPQGSVNVVPGRCRFSLDVRASDDATRDACVADLMGELSAICQRRSLQFSCEETMRAAAAPSSPAWQARWERAVASLGLPVFHLPSGAGHDAMKMHALLPQAMLFVRGQNAGISHNPLESVTHHDADLAVRAFSILLLQLAAESQAGRPGHAAPARKDTP